jgi:cell wall-associated NlpC family hydrolase
MRREARLSGHISVDPEHVPSWKQRNSHASPGCFRGFFIPSRTMNPRIIIVTLLAIATFVLMGCSSSSPRFGKGDKTSSGKSTEHKGPRFASKEAEEESKENTKTVASEEIERIKAGSRDFKKEKNPAIKPLDQSKMMREISRYMGVPYQFGGMTSDGLDCSGYTSLVYKASVGKLLPRTAAEQLKLGRSVRLEDLKFGDLVFFNTTGESGSHVGIYLGDDLFAHASVSLGVTISSLQSFYYEKRYEGARRVIE